MRQFIATLALLLSACSGVPFPEHSPLVSESQREFLHARLSAGQSSTKLIERATLTLRGEELVMTLYAECSAPDELRLAAVSDLGATIFSVEWLSGEMNVQHASEGFPDGLLEQIVSDQVVALLTPDVSDVQSVRMAEGRTAIHYSMAENEVLAFVGEGRGVLQLERGAGGDWLATIELHGSGGTEEIDVRATDGSYSGHFELAPWQ